MKNSLKSSKILVCY